MVKTITAPICPPMASEAAPIKTGNIAPPVMPIIIKPEISLLRVGM